MKRFILFITIIFIIVSCNQKQENNQKEQTQPYILVLGNAQDAVYPQLACQKECCVRVHKDNSKKNWLVQLH